MGLIFCLISQAQKNEDEVIIKPNEIRLNYLYIASSLTGSFYNIDYQRILSQKSSVGLSFGGTLRFKLKIEDYCELCIRPHSLILIPYYRYYIFRKKGSGLFVEGNLFGSYYPHKMKERLGNGFIENSFFEYGGGIATGFKYLTSKGYIHEVLIGGGPTNISGYPRFGFLIGKRF
ncbi:MAG: hypothetical protein H6584_02845 [Flavobacteriales bacterium]|nr:hypothetical protein [Flavobacteriales bacterium]